ncbi:MAG TPA: hypothetical protein PL017_10900 [Tenuifilaceae bacterium]|nr:hypothetical protein [Tenuifilaceae bacterium]HPE19087.1 hypothetical protein [Tenuifilaceae bacterium]HPJ46596.1 hypothetical protein [Tenuifilaceae bacterium]HPQ34968.1 hypothetical protein [Tenuifilaceae bacterium]HRX68754.1 hypothetical protein [Tenuifilaceae bacterium]
MRNALILIVLLLLSFGVRAQLTKDEDQERTRIAESKIKKSIQWTHRYTNNKPNPDGYKTSETQYDKFGNPVEIINYRSNGDISSKLVYRYDSNNQKLEYLMFQKEKDAKDLKLTYKQTFHYNQQGKKTHEVVFDGVAGYRITYSYYADGNSKEIVKYNSTNAVAEKWVYTYNGSNQELKVYTGDDILSYTVQKKFDASGNVIDEARISSNGKEQKRTTYNYNAESRISQMTEFYSGNLIKKLFYKYNNIGVVTEIRQQNPDGKEFVQSTYKHDSNGNLLEERWSEDSSASELSHKQSKYDKDGNLLEMDSYYAPYKYRVLYKYTYEFY